MAQKIAVILFNLGGPDQTDSIKPFLFNFFMDKNIIGAPLPIRYLLAKWISITRSKGEALDAYAQLGGKSPLLDNTRLQAQALERSLERDFDGDIRCFISMRYWHPNAKTTAKQVQDWDPDKIILIPLYPQFSTTTTYSSFEDWQKSCQKIGLTGIETSALCCYPFQSGFVGASADLINHAWQKAAKSGHKMRLLFSAHGLPEKIIEKGDPYQWQCEESARKIAAATGIEDLDWQICYQSRVGPLQWIKPSTDEALEKAAADGVGVLVYPHAFVSEHVETLVEIEDEYRGKAEELGIPYFDRVPTVSTHPKFIVGLKELVLQMAGQSGIVSFEGGPICPAGAKRCCQRQPYSTEFFEEEHA